MSWSTRQLAEIAGTTVRTIRHYHETGLLDEPERMANGYKQYGMDHLMRLLYVKRLADLGMPLAQIATLDETERQNSLLALDQELTASIARLQLIRSELAVLLRDQAPADALPGLGEAAAGLSDTDRAVLLVYTRIFSASVMESIRQMVREYPMDEVDRAFDTLPADADEATRAQLVTGLLPKIQDVLTRNPWVYHVYADAPVGREHAQEIFGTTLLDLYNPAQRDVLRRVLINSAP